MSPLRWKLGRMRQWTVTRWALEWVKRELNSNNKNCCQKNRPSPPTPHTHTLLLTPRPQRRSLYFSLQGTAPTEGRLRSWCCYATLEGPAWCAVFLKCLEISSRLVEHVVNTTFPQQATRERNATGKWSRAQSSLRQNRLQLEHHRALPSSHLTGWLMSVFPDIKASVNCISCVCLSTHSSAAQWNEKSVMMASSKLTCLTSSQKRKLHKRLNKPFGCSARSNFKAS